MRCGKGWWDKKSEVRSQIEEVKTLVPGVLMLWQPGVSAPDLVLSLAAMIPCDEI